MLSYVHEKKCPSRGLRTRSSPSPNEKLISRSDSERELFYDDIVHVKARAYAY